MKITILSDAQIEVLLTNFAGKIDGYSNTLSLSPAEVDSIKADSTYFSYVMDMQNRVKQHSKQWTAHKKILRISAKAVTLGSIPAWTPTAPPPMVNADISGRLGRLIQRIKNHENYTTAIGQDLGIVSISEAPTPAELAALKPILKIHLVAGHPVIEWKKGNTDGIEISKQLPNGDYQFLANDLHPHFQDNSPLPTPGQSQTWKYKAVYILNDKRIGQWSDEVSIGVMG